MLFLIKPSNALFNFTSSLGFKVGLFSFANFAIDSFLNFSTSSGLAPSGNSNSWNDLELLARIINAEAGGCTDEHQLLVGNVVLNRVASSSFPNTIYGVIYQKGQYSPTWNGAINKTPSEQAYKNAQRLLNGERFCPENVVFQANFKQGSGVYKAISTSYSTTYFCYR